MSLPDGVYKETINAELLCRHNFFLQCQEQSLCGVFLQGFHESFNNITTLPRSFPVRLVRMKTECGTDWHEEKILEQHNDYNATWMGSMRNNNKNIQQKRRRKTRYEMTVMRRRRRRNIKRLYLRHTLSSASPHTASKTKWRKWTHSAIPRKQVVLLARQVGGARAGWCLVLPGGPQEPSRCHPTTSRWVVFSSQFWCEEVGVHVINKTHTWVLAATPPRHPSHSLHCTLMNAIFLDALHLFELV